MVVGIAVATVFDVKLEPPQVGHGVLASMQHCLHSFGLLDHGTNFYFVFGLALSNSQFGVFFLFD